MPDAIHRHADNLRRDPWQDPASKTTNSPNQGEE